MSTLQLVLLSVVYGVLCDEGDHIVLDVIGHFHGLIRLKGDDTFENNKHFLERILPNHEFADIVGEFVEGAAIEYLRITNFFEDIDKLRDDGILLVHMSHQVVVLDLYIWIKRLFL